MSEGYLLTTAAGLVQVRFEAGVLVRIHLMTFEPREGEGVLEMKPSPVPGTPQARFVAELDSYLRGLSPRFDCVFRLRGTPFQILVWTALRGIPYGRTTTYGDLARAIGHPQAVRAVGRALGANPLPILLPCHRVVARDGIGGFSADPGWKRWLLEMEGRCVGENR